MMFAPYLNLMRIKQPTGYWLLLLPCLWSITLATEGQLSIRLIAIFFLGSILMRSAGCIINDLVDIEFDKKVSRTKDRPLAAGVISKKKALCFLLILLFLSLVLLLQLNYFAVVVGACSLLLVIIYPFMKRITYWPQAFLGFTFNWGVLLGWAAVKAELSIEPIFLYIAGIFWTLGYDTIYAHQDKEDDILIGVKSTALKFGTSTKKWLIIFYGITSFFLFLLFIYLNAALSSFLLLFLAVFHLFWQIYDVDLNNTKNALAKFKSNSVFGIIVFFAALVNLYS